MNTKTAILIAAIGVVLSLLVALIGGAAAGFYVSQYAPRLAPQSQMLFPRVPNVQIVPPGSERNPSRGVGFQGVQVIEVVKDSPAEKAGIQVGDVILAVDAQNVDTTHPLDQLIGAKKPNDTVQLKIQRGTDTKTISVTLGANPNNASTAYLGIRFAPRLMPMPQSNGG